MTAISLLTTESSTINLPILSLDIGLKRIGVAVSDGLGISCRGILCIQRDPQWSVQALAQIKRYRSRGILVGLAKNMDGTEGKQAEDCRNAAAELAEQTDTPVMLWDERLSSWAARERLQAMGLNHKKINEQIDQTAAAIILESFLASHPELKHA